MACPRGGISRAPRGGVHFCTAAQAALRRSLIPCVGRFLAAKLDAWPCRARLFTMWARSGGGEKTKKRPPSELKTRVFYLLHDIFGHVREKQEFHMIQHET